MSHGIKPGVATGDDVQKIFQFAKEKGFALPAVNVTGSSTVNVTATGDTNTIGVTQSGTTAKTVTINSTGNSNNISVNQSN